MRECFGGSLLIITEPGDAATGFWPGDWQWSRCGKHGCATAIHGTDGAAL